MPDVRPTVGDSSWFVHDRFGLFIHWGIYALPARHEWVKQYEQIPDDVYQTYFEHFDPDLYDPKAWAAAAAGAGMKYFVVTTKHHDGFCLWDTKLTDYCVMNTPYGKDLIRPMAEAFRSQDMKVGFYHSLIDWHHPQFIIDDVHAMRNHPDRAKLNEARDQSKYAEYLHGQVRELLTGYGKVDLLFYDFSYPSSETRVGKGRDDWQSEALVKMTRELMPGILVNDRLDLMDTDYGWDYRTPEQFMTRDWVTVNGRPVVWETCQTFSGSWGYYRDEYTWKSVEQLVKMLIDTVGKGGNLLLNVGPTGRGEFDARALDRLAGMGEWMRRHGRSIYGCTQAPADLPTPADCRLTYNPETNRAYVHIFSWPIVNLPMDGFAGRVKYAQLLNDASEVKMVEGAVHHGYTADEDRKTLTLQLPVRKPDAVVPVVELFLR
jgi:alpha-L-fucosidase